MRRILVTCLIITSFLSELQAQCPGLDQRIRLQCESCSGVEVLDKISSKTNLTFSYSNTDLAEWSIIIDDRSSVRRILTKLLKNRGYTFECIGSDQVLIYRKPAQSREFSGFVVDEASLTPLENVLVYNALGQHTYTNSDGFFYLNEAVSDTFYFSYPGYLEFSSGLIESASNVIRLKEENTLGEIKVIGMDSALFKSGRGGWFINLDRWRNYPSLNGTPGITHKISTLPGMQSTIDVNGGIVVRGGGKNENLTLLDGMEIYNPTHMFGIFGSISDRSLSSVSFFKGNAPSSYSGRVSSVIDMRSKVGDFKKWHGSLDVNPIFGEVFLTGPLKRKKTSVALSIRRSFTDMFPVFYEQIQDQNSIDRFRYYFYDTKMHLTHRSSKSGAIHLSAYSGGDVGYINQRDKLVEELTKTELNKDRFIQANHGAMITWKKRWSSKFGTKIDLGLTNYRFDYVNRYDLNLTGDTFDYDRGTVLGHKSEILDYVAAFNATGQILSKGMWDIGVRSTYHEFEPNASSYSIREKGVALSDTVYGDGTTDALDVRIHAENSWEWDKLLLRYGASLVSFKTDTSFLSVQPSMFASYRISKHLRAHVGWSQNVQFTHAVPNNTFGIPINVWLPSTREVMPLVTQQMELGFHYLNEDVLDVQVDAYRRTMQNAINYRFGVFDLISEWEEAILQGQGRSVGVEFMLRKELGKLSAWVKYVLSKSERKYDEVNNGDWIPFQYDRRHDFSTVWKYDINSKWVIGLTCIYSSGHYITIPDEQYLIEINEQPRLISQFGRLNNLKIPDYMRFDLAADRKINSKKYRSTLSFKVFNILNRQNVFYVSSSLNANGSFNIDPIALFPLLPTINYAIHF